MDDAIRDNTKELTTLENPNPLWDLVPVWGETSVAFDPDVETEYATQLIADSLHLFPPSALHSALVHYGVHSKRAGNRAELWAAASEALVAYYAAGGTLTQPTIIADEHLKEAEEKLRETIERLIEQPKARDKNGRNQSDKTAKKSRGNKKPGPVPQV